MINLINEQYSWKNNSLWGFLEEGNVPRGWKEFFDQDLVQNQIDLISKEIDKIRQTKIIYPPIYQVFRALYLVPVNKINAIVVGMDPYHNGTNEYDGSAVGLCFSVKPGNKINPSLRNIYKELNLEGFFPKQDGNLIHWTNSGVLLLNMALTVEKGKPGSHSDIWYKFTELLIQYISDKRRDSIHWLFFCKDAQKITKVLPKGKFNCCSHPSPFAAHKKCGQYPPFLGSNIFSIVLGIKW
jgi:uracil-DNA glycosylase